MHEYPARGRNTYHLTGWLVTDETFEEALERQQFTASVFLSVWGGK